jgi:hypothetical protein
MDMYIVGVKTKNVVFSDSERSRRSKIAVSRFDKQHQKDLETVLKFETRRKQWEENQKLESVARNNTVLSFAETKDNVVELNQGTKTVEKNGFQRAIASFLRGPFGKAAL